MNATILYSLGEHELDYVIQSSYTRSRSVTNLTLEDGTVIEDSITESGYIFNIQAKFARYILQRTMPRSDAKNEGLEILEKLYRDKQLFVYTCQFGIFPNCILLSYSTSEDFMDVCNLEFTATIQQLLTIDDSVSIRTSNDTVTRSLPTAGGYLFLEQLQTGSSIVSNTLSFVAQENFSGYIRYLRDLQAPDFNFSIF